MKLSYCMNTFMIITTLFPSVAISLRLGAALSLKLPVLDKRLDRKPFNCRPCLTFHLIGMSVSLTALLSRSSELFWTGIPVAFTVFLIVKHIDNKKIIK
ncbi:MAG: hypothetical protein LBN74_08970 [Prevotella sp.]|jgi:hypothetical protein|nr:hypothetical protein [Prevotella sp.]